MSALLLTALSVGLAETSLEAVVASARQHSATARMNAEDLAIADHSVGLAASRLVPRITANLRDTYRYSNPERYTFEYSYDGTECTPTPEEPCLPFVVVEGQVVLPNESWSRSRTLSGSQSLSVDPVMELLLQRERRVSTTVQVRSEEEGLIFELISDYTELQYQRGLLEAYAENLALAEEMEAAVRGQHAAGVAADLDLDSATLDTAAARLDLLQLERSLPLSLDQMALTAGLEGMGAVRVCDFPAPIDEGRALDLSASASVARLESSLKQAQLNRRAGRLEFVPDVTVTGGLTYAGSGEAYGELSAATIFDNWNVGASLSTTLFDGGARFHQRRSDAASLHRAEIDLEAGVAELALDDAELAQGLADIAEEAALVDRSIVLSERNVVATRSQYLDGGQVPLDAYTQARSSLEQLQVQRLALEAERQELTALRWINAGQTDALLDRLFTQEQTLATAGRCTSFSTRD